MTSATPQHPKDLISACLEACRLSWLQAALASSVVLLVGLLAAAWLDGYFASGVDWSFRSKAYFAVTIPYMLLVLPAGKRLWEQAVAGVQPLLPGHSLAQSDLPVDRRREIAVLLIGLAIALAGVPLWFTGPSALGRGQWTTGYLVATGILSTMLFSWSIYLSSLGSRWIAQLCRHDLQIDLFQANVLTPFARWSQFGSIAMIAAIAITLPLQTLETLRSPGIISSYAGLLVFAVLGFFLPLRRIHGKLVESQTQKLVTIRANLQKARADLEQHAAGGGTAGITDLHSQFAAWSLYEQQVKSASTWPFNHKMVRQVLGSTLAPVGIYLLKLAGGALLGRHLLS